MSKKWKKSKAVQVHNQPQSSVSPHNDSAQEQAKVEPPRVAIEHPVPPVPETQKPKATNDKKPKTWKELSGWKKTKRVLQVGGFAILAIYTGFTGWQALLLNRSVRLSDKQIKDFETTQEASISFGNLRSVIVPGSNFQDDLTITVTNYGQTVAYNVEFGYQIQMDNKHPNRSEPELLDYGTSRFSTIAGSIGPKESRDFTMHIYGAPTEEIQSGKILVSVPFDVVYKTIFQDHTYRVPDCTSYNPFSGKWVACPVLKVVAK